MSSQIFAVSSSFCTLNRPNQRAIISPQGSQNIRSPFMDLGYVHKFNTRLGRHETQTAQTACLWSPPRPRGHVREVVTRQDRSSADCSEPSAVRIAPCRGTLLPAPTERRQWMAHNCVHVQVRIQDVNLKNRIINFRNSSPFCTRDISNQRAIVLPQMNPKIMPLRLHGPWLCSQQ